MTETSKSDVDRRLSDLEDEDTEDLNVTTEVVEVVGTDDEGNPIKKDGDTLEGDSGVTHDAVTVSVED